MKFEIGDVLTLADDKDYVVSHAKNYEGNLYMLLIEMPDYKSFKFVKLIDEKNIEEIEDIDLIEKLSFLFNTAEA